MEAKTKSFWVRFLLLLAAGAMTLGCAMLFRFWTNSLSELAFALFFTIGAISVLGVFAVIRKLWRKNRALKNPA